MRQRRRPFWRTKKMRINVGVESRNVTVPAADEPLELAALQSAIPGAIGLSMRTTIGGGGGDKDDNKEVETICLRVDGKFIYPPDDGWPAHDEYIATLGERTAQPSYEVYEKATQRLESTVRLIHKLMKSDTTSFDEDKENIADDSRRNVTNPNGDVTAEDEKVVETKVVSRSISPTSPVEQQATQQTTTTRQDDDHEQQLDEEKDQIDVETEKMQHELKSRARRSRELADAFKRRVVTLQSSLESNSNRLDLWLPRKNTNELERQFAELSAVVAGKDAIIASQRAQLVAARAQQEKLERSTLRLHADVDDYHCKNRALEEELRLLRELSRHQEYMDGKVKQLTNDIENIKTTSEAKLQATHAAMLAVHDDMKFLVERNETLHREHAQLSEQARVKETRLEELHSKVNALQTALANSEKSAANQAQNNHSLNEKNAALTEKSRSLEQDDKERDALVQSVQAQFEQRLYTLYNEFNKKQQHMQQVYEEKCQQTANLHNMMEAMNKKLINITSKYNTQASKQPHRANSLKE